MRNRNMDKLLEKVAAKVLAERLEAVLEARLRELLGEEPEEPAPRRSRAKPEAKPEEPAKAEEPEAQAQPKPRRRVKAQAQAKPEASPSLEDTLKAAELALQKFRGIRTKGGKDYAEVLSRRLHALVRHAQGLGADPVDAVRRAMGLINANPHRYAMGNMLILAQDLGLPV